MNEVKMPVNQIVIDASNAVLGRLCAFAAKQALLGKSVVILNCSKAIITGRRNNIVDEYIIARQRGGASLKGPHFPKDPFRLVKRTIRGMLPYRKARGLTALQNVICYNDVPKEYESAKKILAGRQTNTKAITLGELSRII
jgi:large subunit ribosomal protein L13